MNFYLLKTEPGTYSFETLAAKKKTNWDLVRNYQARNVLLTCKKNDYALIYHSGDEKSVVGLAQVTKEHYPDFNSESDEPGDEKKNWVQIDLKFRLRFAEPVSLKEIKTTAALQKMPLIRHTRLSCMPVTGAEFETLIKMGDSWDAFQKLK